MKQIKVIEPTIETREDKRIGFYDVILKSLEDNVNEFLSTIPDEDVNDIDCKKDMCIITYLK